MNQQTEKNRGEGSAAGEAFFWESKVAKSLGLSRERVRALREAHLSADEWSTRGNAIVFTSGGLEKITVLAARDAGPVPLPSASETPTETATTVAALVVGGAPEVLRVVVKKLCQNIRMMIALRGGDGEASETLLVRVKDNSLFMAGMEIEVADCGNGVWQFRGRLPRRRGRF
jgi:hypothetical protein